ncbi:hypothetical protein PAPYR_13322 [Paratrimastix pyriformis]|uniref:Uncharacterized protein n=1 Tax=Paratrimastix pyriformis TaxID=342808 RepID=A0ABQ8U0H6_9EUKA|nr:hypothetical protein PAPYR_13322 [Paratrimastix pyriformis]
MLAPHFSRFQPPGFVDPAMPWGYGESAAGLTEASMTRIGLPTSYTPLVTLQHAHTYYLTLTAYNKAGLSTRVVSNGITIDLTNPFTNTAIVNNSYPLANCSGYRQSRSVSCVTAQGTANLAHQSGSDEVILGVSSAQACVLRSSGSYEAIWVSIQLRHVLCVQVGDPAVCYQASNIPTVAWDGFWEDVAPIMHYEMAIGTSPGGTQLVPYRWVGGPAARGFTLESPFPDGTVYYFTIRVLNVLSMASQLTSGFNMIDTSPPICEGVFEGRITDQIYLTDPHGLYMQYGRHYDVHSGLKLLKASIAQATPDPFDDTNIVIGWRDVAQDKTYYHWADVVLTPGPVKYYIRLLAENRAGLKCRSGSNGLLVDYDAPLLVPEKVVFPRFPSSLYSFSANWTGAFRDPESGMASVTWVISTVSGGTTHGLTTFLPAVTEAEIVPEPAFVQGGAYYVTVMATNLAGLNRIVGPVPVIVDLTPPIQGQVWLGLGASAPAAGEQTFWTNQTAVTASWANFADPESSLISYDLWLYRLQGGADPTLAAHITLAPTTSPLSPIQRHTFTDLVMASPADYFLRVRATNGAERYTEAESLTFHLTTDAPLVGRVFDGCLAGLRVDETYQRNGSRLCASWEGIGSVDPVDPVARLEYAVGTSNVSLDDTVAWVLLVEAPLADRLAGKGLADLPEQTRVEGLTLTSGLRSLLLLPADDPALRAYEHRHLKWDHSRPDRA